MFRLITSREEYKLRPRFRNPAATPPWAAEPFYWLDAADASNGATSWTSKEGKVFSSSTIAKTNNALNGYPVVGGYKHTWSGSGITMQDGQTIFVVGRITGWTQYQRFVSHANASQADWQTVGGFMPLVSNVSGLLNSGANGTGTDISPVAYSLNTYALWTVRRVGQAVTNAVHNSNGSWLTGDTQNLTAAVTANFTRFSIGIAPHADFSNERWQGQLAEILFYSRPLSSDEYTSTRDWLLAKYAITQGS